MEALFYKELENKSVQCDLCPRECKIKEGEKGYCKVRHNVNGKLSSLVYSKIAALQIDPIEKKPLFHFYPGSRVFSFGTLGCNLRCTYCQNWNISQTAPDEENQEDISPEEIIDLAIKRKCKIIAATYNEPTIFYEFMLDVFKIAKERGLKTVVVSNGFINEKPLKLLLKYTDAFNIDLKGFDKKFYTKLTTAWLNPVLDTIKKIKESGRWLEITNLIIPTKNDKLEIIRELCKWINENLGDDVPLHLSAFFPTYHLLDLPPTPRSTLDMAFDIAKEEHLHFVFQGNVRGEENSFCPKCGELIIERSGYRILQNKIKKGKCSRCSASITGRFEQAQRDDCSAREQWWPLERSLSRAR